MRQDELEKIKAEVLSEIRQRDDDPTGFTFRCFNEVLYEGHPYGKDPIGKERDVEGAALVDLERFYKEYVGPSNAVFAISGDVVVDYAVALKAAYPDRFVWSAGYANGYIWGYLPTLNILKEGGYESSERFPFGPFTDDVEERVMAGTRALVKRVSE